MVAAVVWLPTNSFAAQSDERRQFADFSALYEKWFSVYELREISLHDLLTTILPIVVFFLAWVGYLFYRQYQERSLAHAAMAASRDLLRTIVDTAPVRVFWKDNNLRYLGCNALFAKDAGVAHPKDIIGMDDFQMPWSDDAVRYRSDDVTVMVSGVSKLFYEEQQSTADGRTIWLRTSKVRLTNQNHETMGVLGIYEDVTKRKQADADAPDPDHHIVELGTRVPSGNGQLKSRSSCRT